jgi:hypothetical protein
VLFCRGMPCLPPCCCNAPLLQYIYGSQNSKIAHRSTIIEQHTNNTHNSTQHQNATRQTDSKAKEDFITHTHPTHARHTTPHHAHTQQQQFKLNKYKISRNHAVIESGIVQQTLARRLYFLGAKQHFNHSFRDYLLVH